MPVGSSPHLELLANPIVLVLPLDGFESCDPWGKLQRVMATALMATRTRATLPAFRVSSRLLAARSDCSHPGSVGYPRTLPPVSLPPMLIEFAQRVATLTFALVLAFGALTLVRHCSKVDHDPRAYPPN
jgi:hypothetical protein